jgi:hypothetical protein
VLGRRRFDHLFTELSVAAGVRVPRYALWLALHEAAIDPEALSREGALAFCDGPLPGFLRAHGLSLGPRRARELRRAVARFDPRHPTPYERFAALIG